MSNHSIDDDMIPIYAMDDHEDRQRLKEDTQDPRTVDVVGPVLGAQGRARVRIYGAQWDGRGGITGQVRVVTPP